MNTLTTHQVARDDANLSKGYGFISFANFEASDDAIANMNGQYLMNKEISVQYAYKKDGKGERHGDQAERMLAAQARKHNVQPTNQPLPVGLFTGNTPNAPTALLDMDTSRANGMPQGNVTNFVNGRAPPSGNFHVVPPQQARPTPPSQPLPAPPSGLPARPPPSQAGYGGPQSFLPPGFNSPSQGFPPPGAIAPPGFAPLPAFGPPPGQGPPPGMSQGLPQSNLGRAR